MTADAADYLIYIDTLESPLKILLGLISCAPTPIAEAHRAHWLKRARQLNLRSLLTRSFFHFDILVG